MAGLKGKSGPPGNMNAFKHGLAAIQKRREEAVPTEHEERIGQQILDGLIDDNGGYRLDLEFDDGVSGTVDLSEAVGNGVFSVWRDPLVFEQVRIGSSGELVWGEQVDLCPDALYLRVTGKKPEDLFSALRNSSRPCLRSAVSSASSSRCSSTITTPESHR